ncbi:hypothetical protein [Williamsia deligens]|uniref:Secreted protein n=1 Tax=Williamsia deligens TaxID=321325 RepID=A0ABW3G742_9NOCA|nr:hypothetical protein [Williamsia deligens]
MHGLAVLLFPAVLMLFALAMERMENEVDDHSVHREEVEDFLASAALPDATALPSSTPADHPRDHDDLAHRRDTIEFDLPSEFQQGLGTRTHRAG